MKVVNGSQRPHIKVPRALGKPAVTCDPNEELWARATVIDGLSLSLGPEAAGLSPVPTTIRLLWDEDALYLRYRCESDEIYAPHSGRDAHHHLGDVVEIFIDPMGDARQWYEVQVTPTNQVLDKMFLLTALPEHRQDLLLDFDLMSRELWEFIEWDMPGLQHAAAIDEAGWTVDMALPAEALMRRHGEGHLRPIIMRANFLRYEWRKGIDGGENAEGRRLIAMNWASVRHGQPHVSPGAMGYLELIEGT